MMTGDELQAALKALGWTKVTFAKKLGKRPETVSKWCHGHARVPKYAELVIGHATHHKKGMEL